MKKILTLVLLVLFVIPALVFAATFSANENVSLRSEETIDTNYYAVGGNLILAGQLKQDLVVAGGKVLVTGNVDKDVTAVGGNVDIVGRIGEDLRTAGGQVNISGQVAGDLVAAGGQVLLISGSSVNGDASIAGGRVQIDAPIKGNVKIGGGEVIINSQIDGTLTIMSRNITIGDKAILNGDAVYYSDKDARVFAGAQVKGKLTKEAPLGRNKEARNQIQNAVSAGLFIKLIMMTIAGLALTQIFRKGSAELATQPGNDFGMNFLKGLVFVIGIPFVFVILIVTIVGAPLGVMTGFLYAAAMTLGGIFTGIFAGHLIYKYIFKKNGQIIPWHMVVVGNIAIYLLVFIPVIGWIVCAALFLAVMGTMWNLGKRSVWTNR